MTLLSAGALAWPQTARAQRSERLARIGIIVTATATGYSTRIEALRAGLREFGYIEGVNIAIELRSAEGDYNRIPELIEELLRLRSMS